ncbi:uncharacterized [Tachysurus ichikawai]
MAAVPLLCLQMTGSYTLLPAGHISHEESEGNNGSSDRVLQGQRVTNSLNALSGNSSGESLILQPADRTKSLCSADTSSSPRSDSALSGRGILDQPQTTPKALLWIWKSSVLYILQHL